MRRASEGTRAEGYKSQPLTVFGESLALIGVLLPPTGVVLRYVAFSLDHRIVDPLHVATSASIVDLGTDGAVPVLAAGLFSLLLLGLNKVRRTVDPQIHRRQARSGSELLTFGFGVLERWMVWLLRAPAPIPLVALIVLLACLLFAPQWPLVFLFLISQVIIQVAFRLLVGNRPATLARVWPGLLFLLLTSAIAFGIAGDVTSVSAGNYVFESSHRELSGFYALLGSTGSFDYLLPCGTTSEMIAVPAAEATLVRYPRPLHQPDSSLWAILFHRAHVRLAPEILCPVTH